MICHEVVERIQVKIIPLAKVSCCGMQFWVAYHAIISLFRHLDMCHCLACSGAFWLFRKLHGRVFQHDGHFYNSPLEYLALGFDDGELWGNIDIVTGDFNWDSVLDANLKIHETFKIKKLFQSLAGYQTKPESWLAQFGWAMFPTLFRSYSNSNKSVIFSQNMKKKIGNYFSDGRDTIFPQRHL